MVDSELDFESARNKAILNVMKKDRERYAQLEKNFKKKCSEYMVLKQQHLTFLEQAAEDKIKCAEQTIKLKQKIIFLKDQVKSLKLSLSDWEKHCEMYHVE